MDEIPSNEGDLQKLIDIEAQESLTLEFKRSDSLGKTDGKKSELSKDISAFANSSGGIILYGIEEDGHVAKALDQGLDPNVISKEWVEQVINSTIQKRIEGIVINQIPLSNSPNHVAYAVKVPLSLRAPHQAHDKRFYKRYNFQSVAMEEYEIQDVRNRVVAPDLKVELGTVVDYLRFEPTGRLSDPIPLWITVSNDSYTPANYAVIEIYIDERIEVTAHGGYEYSENYPLEINGEPIFCKRLTKNWGIPTQLPIWQGKPFSLDSPTVRLPVVSNGASYIMGYKLSSPGMAPKSRYRVLNQGSRQIAFTKEYVTDEVELAKQLGL